MMDLKIKLEMQKSLNEGIREKSKNNDDQDKVEKPVEKEAPSMFKSMGEEIRE